MLCIGCVLFPFDYYLSLSAFISAGKRLLRQKKLKQLLSSRSNLTSQQRSLNTGLWVMVSATVFPQFSRILRLLLQLSEQFQCLSDKIQFCLFGFIFFLPSTTLSWVSLTGDWRKRIQSRQHKHLEVTKLKVKTS